jgi:hypothetical protein
MNNIKPEDAFLGAVGGMMFGPEAESGSLEDSPRHTTGVERENLQKEVEKVVDYIKMAIFPLWGIQ